PFADRTPSSGVARSCSSRTPQRVANKRSAADSSTLTLRTGELDKQLPHAVFSRGSNAQWLKIVPSLLSQRLPRRSSLPGLRFARRADGLLAGSVRWHCATHNHKEHNKPDNDAI